MLSQICYTGASWPKFRSTFQNCQFQHSQKDLLSYFFKSVVIELSTQKLKNLSRTLTLPTQMPNICLIQFDKFYKEKRKF